MIIDSKFKVINGNYIHLNDKNWFMHDHYSEMCWTDHFLGYNQTLEDRSERTNALEELLKELREKLEISNDNS